MLTTDLIGKTRKCMSGEDGSCYYSGNRNACDNVDIELEGLIGILGNLGWVPQEMGRWLVKNTKEREREREREEIIVCILSHLFS